MPSLWGWQDLLLSQQGGLLGPGHGVLETLSTTVWEVSPKPRPAQVFPYLLAMTLAVSPPLCQPM